MEGVEGSAGVPLRVKKGSKWLTGRAAVVALEQEREREILEREIADACKFMPSINKQSEKIVKERGLSAGGQGGGHGGEGGVVARLSKKDEKRRKEVLQSQEKDMYKECSFKPNLSANVDKVG